jgi:hypothetical protein
MFGEPLKVLLFPSADHHVVLKALTFFLHKCVAYVDDVKSMAGQKVSQVLFGQRFIAVNAE